jgi:LmbE family N-acetylglucosaminyl deacetylase
MQPARVLTWSPEWSWRRFHRNHPDHRAAGEAALSAIFPDARNPFSHPELLDEEGLEPWEVGAVWLIGSPSPNHYVDITDVFDRKIAALRAHESQTAHRDRVGASYSIHVMRPARIHGSAHRADPVGQPFQPAG